MAIEAERLIIDLEARLSKFERDMRRASGVADTNIGRIEARATVMTRRLNQSFSGIGKTMAAAFAGAITIRGAEQLIDTSVRIQNALKVVGLEGDNLKSVYDQLFASAQRNAAPIESLVQLYSRLALNQKELGATSKDLVDFSDTIAVALRVGGVSAEQASGALLQLSQSLGSGVVRAEEFNSVLEGAPTILQAAANGITEAHGSVAELRKIMLAGQLSSKALFRGIEAGAPSMRDKLAGAQRTISQSFVVLRNELVNAAKDFNKSTKATELFGRQLEGLATYINHTNFDQIIGEIQSYIDKVNAAGDATRTWIEKMSKASGLSAVGDAFASSTVGQALGVQAPITIKDRMNGFGNEPGGALSGALDGYIAKTYGEAAKGSRVLADGANAAGDASKNATVSIKDLGVEAANAASKIKNPFPDGGAVSDYVKNVIGAESGGKAGAKNPNSSATGLGQFIESTWLQLFKENFPDRAASMSRETILALRSDAEISKQLIEAYAKQNADVLRTAGVSVNEAALHLSHFLGAGDAVKVLKAASGTPLAGLISPASIQANPAILGGGKTVDDAIAYAQRRATSTRIAAGNLTPDEEALRDRSKAYDELVSKAVEYIGTQNAEAAALGLTQEQAAALRYEQELLNRAAEAGLTLTPEQTAQLKQLAAAMAQGDVATKNLKLSQRDLARAQAEFRDLGKDVLGGFISDLRQGKSASEALADALGKVADKLIDMSLDSLFSPKGGGGLGALFGGIGKLFGFASGGYTGAGGKYQPAGIVHKGEYVIPKSIVDKVGPKNLGALFNGYADGGLVSSPVPLSAPQMNARSAAEVVHIRLQDDSGRMADIADQQIRTRSGDIVRISVDQSLKQGSRKFPRQQADQQRRTA